MEPAVCIQPGAGGLIGLEGSPIQLPGRALDDHRTIAVHDGVEAGRRLQPPHPRLIGAADVLLRDRSTAPDGLAPGRHPLSQPDEDVTLDVW